MALYKLGKSFCKGEDARVVLKQDNPNIRFSIPFDPDNKDYQEYLEWVAKGNTADAAD
tara:strand:+ start:237 stop:410 length:174 start_codon:yes stop_codon:yes gene_type:complete